VSLKSIISPLDDIAVVNLTVFSLRSAVATEFRVLAFSAAPVLVKMTLNSIDSKLGFITDLQRRRNTSITKRIESNLTIDRLHSRIMEVEGIKRNSILADRQSAQNTLAILSLISTMATISRSSFPD